MKRSSHWITAVIAFVVSAATFGAFQFFQPKDTTPVKVEHVNTAPSAKVLYTKGENGNMQPLDFTKVAAQVTNAVVHIKSSQRVQNRPGRGQQGNPMFEEFFRDFFGGPQGPRSPQGRRGQPEMRVGTGSGVIISSDGYIVTNNHVIDNADEVEVTLSDNRNFKATVIGTDPTTDLALLKIEGESLKTVQFFNSDQVQVGEWVLAVGNPFNLNSTVTAGIVSAKGRNINILREQFAVESFIQTDAAINPGNSGGALVNLNGDLIGINTAIASPTGSYSGYGFAVPTNIVRKVVEDLKEYGVVQRGVLGVMIRTIDGNLSREKDLDVTTGVFVDSLLANSAAAAAGIKAGDVITAVNGLPIETTPMLQEAIAQYRPGDAVNITVNRNGKARTFDVILNNQKGNTALVEKAQLDIFAKLGADFETLDAKISKRLNLEGGVKVTNIEAGVIRQQTQMGEGFIITKVDGTKVTTVEALQKLLQQKTGGIMVEGRYADTPGTYYYAFGIPS